MLCHHQALNGGAGDLLLKLNGMEEESGGQASADRVPHGRIQLGLLVVRKMLAVGERQ
jgi:hypothetical protein